MMMDWETEAEAAARALDEAQQRPGRPAWTQEPVTTRNLLQKVPPDWSSVEREHPVQAPKTRVTIRLDAEVAEWFREQGRGHQTRMNAVLRAYMLCCEGEVI